MCDILPLLKCHHLQMRDILPLTLVNSLNMCEILPALFRPMFQPQSNLAFPDFPVICRLSLQIL